MTQKKCQNFVYFTNVAKDTGDENIKINRRHSSIIKIEENKTDDTELNVKLVTEEYANKQISKSNIKIKQQGKTSL